MLEIYEISIARTTIWQSIDVAQTFIDVLRDEFASEKKHNKPMKTLLVMNKLQLQIRRDPKISRQASESIYSLLLPRCTSLLTVYTMNSIAS